MGDELRQVAMVAGMDKDVVEKLDQLLTGPNDRAFVVCTYTDCQINIKGRCTIFTVMDVPKMKTGQPCQRYQPATPQSSQ
ncbi:hypothetical protein L4X63_00535 [Geomonas sp. Red32]|uniref:hypothetical protein n=1 Tax=Geomonas sp. Red32 TaxID=2912856 RepID=UPI00202CDC50|nr:hypothetical protein [Geomonas sp. Red32]MCM0080069.1 hypothetical protein [Geomonas sp. Red32]